ncbi:replicase [Erysiphe necator associated ssRNA virus 6]|nr:replicase [Erysiphe necator associated ssRNA virus 6]
MASRLDLSRFRESPELVRAEPVRPTTSSTTASSMVAESDYFRTQTTPAVVDEAVNKVLSQVDFDPDVKDTFRKLLATDSNSGFATSFFSGKVDGTMVGAHPRLQRRTIHVNQVLTPEETSDLVSYAPEFEFRFHDRESHDHAMAAAMRKVDTELLLSIAPRKISIKDVGGDPLYHVNNGTPNIHVCNPVYDPKDPSRGTLRHMKISKIARDLDRSLDTRALAQRYLSGDKSFACGGTAEDCHHKAKVSMSVHVYDIKMEDWPKIMENCGASMHVGVVLFPKTAYDSAVGELSSARARYEIDTEKNEFRMGFIDSPSWWYSHNWLDYMRYGVDQIIAYKGARYSYKVTERRGDTLFFQILKVAGEPQLARQCYRLPTVPMVRVDGFELETASYKKASSPIRPKVHWFPSALWEDMLQEGCMMFERGVMTYDRLYNYYRVVSPRNTINGVLIAGGQRVAQDQLVALITHVGLCAASTVMLAQKTSRALTAEIQAKRGAVSGLARFAQLFLESVSLTAGRLFYGPLQWFCEIIAKSPEQALLDQMVEWSYEPQVVDVKFSSLVGDGFSKMVNWQEESPEDIFRSHYLEMSDNDHIIAMQQAPALATMMMEVLSDDVTPEQMTQMRAAAASTVGGTTVVGSEANVNVDKADETLIAGRRNAIQECIDESKLENQKLESSCEKIFRACTFGNGSPDERVLRTRAEEYYQPDLWEVRNGVIVSSVLGLKPADCRYSALFTLKTDVATGSRFRTVYDDTYKSVDGGETKEYKVFSDSSYTGYALSMDRLLIYNGPEIQETLALALDMSHDYVVELRQGPPGCGKTYSLLQALGRQDVAMCPVRESAMDTRARLLEKDPRFPDARLKIRTVDSYLVNYRVAATKAIYAETLHADEAFMTHSGKWYAAAALLGVKRIVAYGDVKQIPHVPRVQAPSLYLRLLAQVQHTEYLTRRCPADSVAAWGHVYDWRVRSTSDVKHSLSVTTDWQQKTLKDGHVLLCMYQADKKELRKMFSSFYRTKRLQIMTVHESEGKTFDDVWLFRFDTRPRDDNMSLFDQEPYVLVGMSRHRKSFCYVRPRVLGDLVDKWIQNAADPRVVAAAADVKSAGQSMRFL